MSTLKPIACVKYVDALKEEGIKAPFHQLFADPLRDHSGGCHTAQRGAVFILEGFGVILRHGIGENALRDYASRDDLEVLIQWQ